VDADFFHEDKRDDDEHASEVEATSSATTSRRSALMEWAYRRLQECPMNISVEACRNPPRPFEEGMRPLGPRRSPTRRSTE
jgi:hypothetical protein